MMMEIDAPGHFSTKDDEIRYWMNVAQEMYQRKEDVEQELIEYQENSQILERELETSYEQTDRKNRNLCQENMKLTTDNGQLKSRLKQQIAAYSTLQSQHINLEMCNDQLIKCVRELEQKNDDLERTNRETKVAEEEMETQFNMVVEKLALLETEVDEKESLKIKVQRLKDENKDLKHQIEVERLQHSGNQKDNEIYRANSIKYQSYRNSTGSPLCAAVDQQKYIRELEQKVEYLEEAHRLSKIAEKEMVVKMNGAVEKIALLESELSEKENFTTTIQQLKEENRDLSQEMQVRLRSHKDKTAERSRPRSHSSSKLVIAQEDKQQQRSSTANRVSRHIEHRAKKGKDEDKRQQNLTWFLKRLRYSQPNWMRRKE